MPVKHNDGYQTELAGRGTPLGDTNITENLRMKLAFRGVPVVPIPLMTGISTIAGSEIDYDSFVTSLDLADPAGSPRVSRSTPRKDDRSSGRPRR